MLSLRLVRISAFDMYFTISVILFLLSFIFPLPPLFLLQSLAIGM